MSGARLATRRRSPVPVVAEAVRTLRTQWVTSTLVAVLAAAVATTTCLTAGHADASRRAVLETVDGVGSALVVVSDTGAEPLLDGRLVADVEAMSSVEWVFGLGPAEDVANAHLDVGSAAAPSRAVVGDVPPDLVRRAGAEPGPGEVTLGEEAQRRLGMEVPAGGVISAGRALPVVGGFGATGPLARLSDLALAVPEGDPASTRLLHLYVRAESPESVAAVEAGLRSMLPEAGRDDGAVTVETSEDVVVLRQALERRLDGDAAALLGIVLGAGTVVAFAVTWMGTLGRRADIGRRRALGATRSATVALVLGHTTLAATCGAAVGTAGGVATTTGSTGQAPGLGFVLSLVVLTVLSAACGCALPALAAARSDPVRVLRVP